MSSTDAAAAVERIRTDEPFARSVAAQGPEALVGFDLDDTDRTAIVDAVRLDLAEDPGEGDVEGFGVHRPLTTPFANLLALEFGPTDQTTITTPPDELYPTKPGKARKPWA